MTFKNSIQLFESRRESSLLVLICWATLCLSASHAQETPLAWKFKQGDEFQVKTTKLSKRTSTLDSRISTIRCDVSIEFNWTVDSIDDTGTATITQELERFSIDVGDPAVPAQAIKYASDDAPTDLPTPMRKIQRKSKPLIGLKCILTMASSGEVTSVQLDAASQKKLEKLTDAPNLKALFNKESLEKISSDFSLNAIPANADTTGWTKTEVQNSGFGKVSIDHEFSVGSSETIKGRELIEIDVVSSLTQKKTDEATKKPTAKNEISQSLISYAGSGSITFDQAGGYFSGSQFQTKTKSERQYREKVIMTSLENETRIEIEKK